MDMSTQDKLNELRTSLQGVNDPQASVETLIVNFPSLLEDAKAKIAGLGVTNSQLAPLDELIARLRTDAPLMVSAVMGSGGAAQSGFAETVQAEGQPSDAQTVNASPGVSQMAPNPDAGIPQQRDANNNQ